MKKIIFCCLALGLMACSCSKSNTQEDNNNTKNRKEYQKVSPDFNADSAYHYIDTQVSFGTRVPNSKGHIACGDYLVASLKKFGADVQEQKMTVKAFDGTKLNARNIIGSYGLDKKKRILLFAHWDTRPFADHDKDESRQKEPILGANDGGSGVGVLLEVARNIQQKSPEVGIDFIFFDAEDYGEPAFSESTVDGDWWCLGSQYWAESPHVEGYKAHYGILLDMVGAKDAKFYKERFSKQFASNIVDKIWSTARKLGYGKFFPNKTGGYTTDDHLFANRAGIPSVDIIQYEPEGDTSFGHYWHTHQDNMDVIDTNTLKAVGQTVMEVIYKEKAE